MEDPYLDMEESIEKYSSEESGGKVRWILSKGLTLGKKMLLTGLVISSAPVVLPPLVVLSFIGFACSVPYGLFLASYACTNEVMSKLLPGSKPPPFLLEYGKVESTDEEVEKGEGELIQDSNELVEEFGYEEDVGEYGNEREDVKGEELGLKAGDIDMEKEEEEISEDTREMLEIRIELVDKGNDEVVEGVGEEEVQEPAAEESGDQLPVDEVQAIVVGIEGDEKIGGTAEALVAPFEVTNIDVELCQNIDIKEDEEIVKETRGLLEKIKEEGMTDKEEKDYKQSAEGSQEVNRNVEEVRMPSEDKIGNARVEKPPGKVEKNREKSRLEETGYAQNADVIPKERSPEEKVGGSSEKKGVTSNIPEVEKPIVRMNEANKVGNNRQEKQKPGVDKTSTLQATVGAKDNIYNKAKQKNQVNREKQNAISSNADAREVADESFDKKDAASHQFYVDNEAVQGHKQNEAGISSQEDSGIASSKALYSEEMIWDQIDAMRRIVGYKAARKAANIEELKALYLFTGVEPPTMFKDPSDLLEVNHKLKFLMSIVGVK